MDPRSTLHLAHRRALRKCNGLEENLWGKVAPMLAKKDVGLVADMVGDVVDYVITRRAHMVSVVEVTPWAKGEDVPCNLKRCLFRSNPVIGEFLRDWRG